jgi:hypothetical protein
MVTGVPYQQLMESRKCTMNDIMKFFTLIDGFITVSTGQATYTMNRGTFQTNDQNL